MTDSLLHLAHEIDLPHQPVLLLNASETTTQTLGVIAAKGAGKSYLGTKLAELLYGAGAPFVVLDPVGNWSSVTLAADGKASGIDLVVVGGDRADIPIDSESGDGGQARKLGQFLLENGFSAVLDLSELSKAKRKIYVADFCESLFRTARAVR